MNTKNRIIEVALSTLSNWPHFAAATLLIIACSVMAGWLTGIEVLKRIDSNFVAMNPATAIGFALAGAAIWLEMTGARDGMRRHFWNFAAIMSVLIGSLRLIGYWGGWEVGIDQILFRSQLANEFPQPNRMAPNTALLFVLFGASMLLLNSRAPRARIAGEILCLIAVLVAVFATLGYLFGAQQMYGIGAFIPMALHTAACFLILGSALLAMHPTRGVMSVLTSRHSGGVMARRLLPATIGITIVLSWLRLEGQKSGLYEIELGVALMAASMVAMLTATIWWYAATVNRADVGRLEAERALRHAHANLELLVQERTSQLQVANNALTEEVAERASAQRMLAEKAADLKRSNLELEQFAYVASHDLQEPLRMVGSYLQLLERRYAGKLDESALEFIGFAVDGATRMKQLINDLLQYSRVDRKGGALTNIDCNSILGDALANLKGAIDESGAEITTAPLPNIFGDSGQIRQLFQNLVGNALKFRKRPDSARITIKAEPIENGWCFSVADNGIGIDPEYATRIFEIFQRLHSREDYPGTGIGLAICKKIVERHGGHIWVEPELGRGSVFKFTILDRQESHNAYQWAA